MESAPPQTSTTCPPTLAPPEEQAVTQAVMEDERLPTSGGEESVATGDLDNRSFGDNSLSGSRGHNSGEAPSGLEAQHQQGCMLYPSTEAAILPRGEQQMLYFNPAAAGYSNVSQGYDPREGYPVVYPYVPIAAPREKKKKGYCC